MTLSPSRTRLGGLLPALLAVVMALGFAGAVRPAATPVKVSTITVSIPISVWTNVNSGSPATSYWTSQRDAIRVGKNPSTNAVYRAFLQADVTSLHSRAILDARLSMVLDHSASCGQTPVQLWQLNTTFSPSAPVNWINTAGVWIQPVSTVFAAANINCGQPPAYVQFSGAGLTDALGLAVVNEWSQFAVGLRAQNEADMFQWKKFRPTEMSLIVTYSD